MNCYRVKFVSQDNAFLSVLLLLTFVVGISILNPRPNGHANHLLVFCEVSTTILAFVFIFQKIATGIVEWTIDAEGFEMKWVKQFYWDKNSDLKFKWNEIQSFKKSFGGHYSRFVIKLNSGEKLKFYHANDVTDDFDKLLMSFRRYSTKS